MAVDDMLSFADHIQQVFHLMRQFRQQLQPNRLGAALDGMESAEHFRHRLYGASFFFVAD